MVDPRAAVVAARASAIGLARELDLPDDLVLWSLAGGRPDVPPAMGEPEDLGLLLEASHDAGPRRAAGAHYTPARLALDLAARALVGHDDPSVCDPTCGGGALLLAIGRVEVDRGADAASVVARLWGADEDPLAVATTEAALTLWAGVPPPVGHLVVADTLRARLGWPAFDVVVGNPPFLSQLDTMTTRSIEDADLLRERFGDAVRAYTDTAALFLLVACEMAGMGGTVALIQPQSVLAARDAAGVRAAVDAVAAVREVWVPPGRPFRAAVHVCVPMLEVGAPTTAAVSWSGHLARALGVPEVRLADGRTLGDEATTSAAFRAEYYGMVPHVHEAETCPEGRPLLTTGLVDLGHSGWGERPARIAGRRFDRPVVDVASLEGRAAEWARRAAAPKLIVATQTRVVEVVVDPDGSFVPAVPLVVAWANVKRLWALAAALASPPIVAWAAQRCAGTALSPGALKLTAGIVREAPLPVDADAWLAGSMALQAGDAAAFAEAMTNAYGCSADVGAWWLDRVGSAWSGRVQSR